MHAAHLEQILHDIHEAHDVHYTPVTELCDVVASHLPNDTGVALTDIHMAIWNWRMSNRVCVLVDDSGNVIHRPLLWYMAIPEVL
jgi:hypothetical protein